jgi:hypothetical protein
MDFTPKMTYKEMDYPHKLAYNNAVCMVGFLFKTGSGFKEKFQNEDFQVALYAFVDATVKFKDAEKALETYKTEKCNCRCNEKTECQYLTKIRVLKHDLENAQAIHNDTYDKVFKWAKHLNFEEDQDVYDLLEKPARLGTSF